MSNKDVIAEMRTSIARMEDLLREYEEQEFSKPIKVAVMDLLPGMVLSTGDKILSKPIYLNNNYWALSWFNGTAHKLVWNDFTKVEVVNYRPAKDLPLITALESPVWVTADKRRLYPAEFADKHLLSTIEWLETHPTLYVHQERDMLMRMGKGSTARKMGAWPSEELVKNSSLYRSLVAEAQARDLA